MLPYDAAIMPNGRVCLATSDGLWSFDPARRRPTARHGSAARQRDVEPDKIEMCPLPSSSEEGGWFANETLCEWSPDTSVLRSLAREPGTVPCAVAARAGWRAEAWLDSSLVRLVHADGRATSIACSGPRTLAWVGQSLIVSTQSGELLRFPDLLARLNR